MNEGADAPFRQRMQRIEGLLRRIEEFADPVARETAREVVRTLMEWHGAGLAAILDQVRSAGPVGQPLLDSFARHELISTLLLLYELHPIDLADRVRRALDEVRSSLPGAEVELLPSDNGTVRVRLAGSFSPDARDRIEEALLGAAPDAQALEIEEVPTPSRLVPLPVVLPR
jgi:hypothetical protein